jgi:hypothetical protein
MRQQTKREIWYWMIMGVSIIILLAFAYGSRDKEGSGSKETEVSTQEETEGTESAEEKETAQTQPGQGGAVESNPITKEITGGKLGQSYLLAKVAVKDQAQESWLTIHLQPESYSQLPRYQAKLENAKITLTLSDTTDFDITTGQTSYQGQYNLAGQGIISKVKVIRASGNQMKFEITLNKNAPYQVKKLLNPLRLTVRVTKS